MCCDATLCVECSPPKGFPPFAVPRRKARPLLRHFFSVLPFAGGDGVAADPDQNGRSTACCTASILSAFSAASFSTCALDSRACLRSVWRSAWPDANAGVTRAVPRRSSG